MAEVLRAHRVTFLASVGIELLHQALTVAVAGLAAFIVASAATGAVRSDLLELTAILVGLVVVRAVAAWVSTLVSHRLAFRILADIRMWAYWSFERTSPGTSPDRRTGDLMARVMSDAEALEVFYAHISVNAAVAVVLPPSILIGLGLWTSWGIPAVLIPWMLICATVPFWFERRNIRDGDAVRERTADVGNSVMDMIGGLRELLAFSGSAGQRSKIMHEGKLLANAQRRQVIRSGLEHGIANAVVGCGVLCVIVVGARYVSNQVIPSRMFPPMIVISASAFGPLLAMLNGARIGGMLRSSAMRMFDLIEEPSSISGGGSANVSTANAPEIRFEAVTFTYPGRIDPVIKGIDLTVRSGETIALVGPTGAGKSTLAHLLLRYFDPTGARITVDGVDVVDMA